MTPMSAHQQPSPRTYGAKHTDFAWMARWRNGCKRLWTAEEVAKVAHAFLDLDLDGPDLYEWCDNNGVDRTPGAIDVKLQELNFFDEDAERRRRVKAAKALKDSKAHAAKQKAFCDSYRRQQIALAKLEMAAGVPPLKTGKLEW
jgi:hypothetical protein